MRLAISNIAWPPAETEAILPLVRGAGCSAIEVAPSRIWPEPGEADRSACREFRNLVENHGLSIVSLHSLLYTRPDLGLFRGAAVDDRTVHYLGLLAALAADLDARVLVFGSPRNRTRGSIPFEKALSQAADTFRRAAILAADHGVRFLIEPLTPQETDFIRTAAEGIRLVKLVNHPGFGLHLDAKSVAEEGEKVDHIFSAAVPFLGHFHINDPGLVELGSVAGYHREMGPALVRAGYAGYRSIEMQTVPEYRRAIVQSIDLAKTFYT